jgi:hypothetical protein
VKLNRPLDFAGAQATGADVETLYFTLNKGFDALDVGFPAALGFEVRVADIHAAAFAFAADFANIGHLFTPPSNGQELLCAITVVF